MICNAAAQHGTAAPASGYGLPAAAYLRLLALPCALALLPILAALAALAFGVGIAGFGPAQLVMAAGLVGMGWLIGANRALDALPAGADAATLARMQRSNAELERALDGARARLDRLLAERDALELQLNLDPLTGARNRRGLEAAFAAHGPGTVMALLDIDHFKRINDTLGHDVGDRVLRDFAGLLRERLKGGQPVWRVGGEEFVVLFPGARMQDVANLLEGFRADLRRGAVTRQNDPVAVSFSAGLALSDARTPGFAETFKRADARLYAAKAAGRARIMLHDPELAAAA